MMPESRPDYYALLGVDRDADGEAIRAAYRTLAKQHHPDTADRGGTAEATEQFIRIQQAYDVLGDPASRAQYDRELREAELAAMILRHRALVVQPPAAPPRRPTITGGRLFLGAAALLVVGAVLYIWQQQVERRRELESQITVVRVDPPRAGGPLGGTTAESKRDLPPDLSVLAKEMERLSRLQVARVEEAKKRVREEVAKAERKIAESSAQAAAPAAPSPTVKCAGGGRAFSIVRENDTTSVSYNGGPPVHPKIADLGTGLVVLSGVEPTNMIAIGFMKGDKDRTVVLLTDANGNVYRTVGVDCTAAAF